MIDYPTIVLVFLLIIYVFFMGFPRFNNIFVSVRLFPYWKSGVIFHACCLALMLGLTFWVLTDAHPAETLFVLLAWGMPGVVFTVVGIAMLSGQPSETIVACTSANADEALKSLGTVASRMGFRLVRKKRSSDDARRTLLYARRAGIWAYVDAGMSLKDYKLKLFDLCSHNGFGHAIIIDCASLEGETVISINSRWLDFLSGSEKSEIEQGINEESQILRKVLEGLNFELVS